MAARLTTTICVRCGRILYDVPVATQYCRDCYEMVKREQRRRDKQKQRYKQQYLAPAKVKTLDQCAKEAAELGLSYGEYIARGLDKR